MIDAAYFRGVVSALEKALYYERGTGALFRATMVGIDHIDRKAITGNTAEQVVDNCIKVLVDDGVIEKADYEINESGSFFTFEIQGCTHLPVEVRLKEEGVPAYICPPINIILYKIRQMVDLAAEIADITVHHEEGKCVVRVVVYKQG